MRYILTSADTQTEDLVENIEKTFLENYVDGAMPGILNFAIDVILAFVVFLIGTRIVKWVVKLLKKSMEKANAEQGVVTFVGSVVRYVLYFVLILMILSHFGVTASSVIAVLGSAGLTLGLALQGSLSNLAGGVLILLLKPFVVGDYIIENADKQEGTVAEITIFYTKLLTIDNKAIMIPNGTLSNTSIVNVTAMNKRRLDLRFSVAYDSDIQKVKEILSRVAIGDVAVLKNEDSSVFVSELKESCVEMGARCWVKTEDYWAAKWRITENIKTEFDKEGICIPFPQMEITMKSN